MRHVAGSFPDQPFVAQQNLGRGCLQKACATQTQPTRENKSYNKKKANVKIPYEKGWCVTHPFLWQWRDDDIGIGHQEVRSEQLKLTVAPPQGVGSSRRTSFWDRFSWPSDEKDQNGLFFWSYKIVGMTLLLNW